VLQQLLVAAVLLLLVGQVVPRALARRWGTALIPVLAPVLQVLDALFGPILGFAGRVARRFVTPAGPLTPEATDPLEDLLRDAQAEGIGEAGEAEIISGVVEFGEKRVGDVMTPRERVTAVSRGMPGDDIARIVATSAYSRVPVFSEGGEAVVGVLHAFDVLVHPHDPLNGLRGAAVARPDEPCGVVMRRMLREHRHMAIVQRAGVVTGIVTLEDLMEELVGDIRDEHDEPVGSG
jgi:putative hemolysin